MLLHIKSENHAKITRTTLNISKQKHKDVLTPMRKKQKKNVHKFKLARITFYFLLSMNIILFVYVFRRKKNIVNVASCTLHIYDI